MAKGDRFGRNNRLGFKAFFELQVAIKKFRVVFYLVIAIRTETIIKDFFKILF